jgi:hypothetical protein
MGARRGSRRRDSVDLTVMTAVKLAVDPAQPAESAVERLLRVPPGGHLLRRARARVAAALSAHPSPAGERALGFLDAALARTVDVPDRGAGTTAHPDRRVVAGDVVHA